MQGVYKAKANEIHGVKEVVRKTPVYVRPFVVSTNFKDGVSLMSTHFIDMSSIFSEFSLKRQVTRFNQLYTVYEPEKQMRSYS